MAMQGKTASDGHGVGQETSLHPKPDPTLNKKVAK